MADESGNNGSSIVAIFAIVVLAGLVVFFFMYVMPRMRPAPSDNPGINVQVDLPDMGNNGGDGGGE